MLNVGNNLLGSPLGSFGAGPTASLASLANTASAGESAAANALSDAVSPTAQAGTATAGATSAWSGSGNSAGGYIAQFMSLLFNAYTQLAQYVGGMFGQPPWGGTGTTSGSQPPSPTPGPGGGIPQPPIQAPSSGQTYFSSATASSVGDPHDAFNGTTGTGQTVDGGRWDNMSSHPFLLRSQSFDGGFHIDTDAGQPGPKGATRNGSVTIDSDFGNHSVTMNRDGSYSILDNGQQVQLAVGQSHDLGDGESVTLNSDHSLTVVEQNGQGGSITTTLRAPGPSGDGSSESASGVNVRVQAQDVDLGGYLVQSALTRESSGASAQGAAAAPLSTAAAAQYAPSQPAAYQSQEPFEEGGYEPFQAQEWNPGALAVA